MDRSLNAGPNGAVYLVFAARTPIGKFAGALADVPATTLRGIAIAAAVERAGVPADSIDEVLMGQVLQAGVRQGRRCAGRFDWRSAEGPGAAGRGRPGSRATGDAEGGCPRLHERDDHQPR